VINGLYLAPNTPDHSGESVVAIEDEKLNEVPEEGGEEPCPSVSNPKDPELFKEFIRIEKTKSGVQILVCEIEWDCQTPISKWVAYKEFPADTSETEIQNVAAGILEDSRYFRFCEECRERHLVGQMHDDRICQGCAAGNHGIIY